MNMSLRMLEITIVLSDEQLFNQLVNLFKNVGKLENKKFVFISSSSNYVPIVTLDVGEFSFVVFSFSDGSTQQIHFRNITCEERKSPHLYIPISVNEYQKRMRGKEIVGIDHAGVNLPWFKSGYHPDFDVLRMKAKSTCAYHSFPTGEPWDFIIPATREEISGKTSLDYSKIRKPKFELVTFEKSSIPLVQFDVNVKLPYEQLITLFPESIQDDNLRNLWVYLKNKSGDDICLVLNEQKDGDWSDFFKDSRLN